MSLTLLGQGKTEYPQKPEDAKIETFDNSFPQRRYLIVLQVSEFTHLCPVTGQPDWAQFEILYVPDKKCIESKALKLYLFSFRSVGEFHESITNRIMTDLWDACNPWYIRVIGDFNARGGIKIVPLVETVRDGQADSQTQGIRRLVGQWDMRK